MNEKINNVMLVNILWIEKRKRICDLMLLLTISSVALQEHQLSSWLNYFSTKNNIEWSTLAKFPEKEPLIDNIAMDAFREVRSLFIQLGAAR